MSENTISKDSMWEIDTINYDGWQWTALDGAEFILELVHEIERLQKEGAMHEEDIRKLYLRIEELEKALEGGGEDE